MKNQLRLLTSAFLVVLTTTATATIRYVDLNCTNATPPFTNWISAATNIQDAVDAAAAGDEVVVTNGVYASGGRAVYCTMTNRVAVTKPVTLLSVNGPKFTIIQGAKAAGGGNGDGSIRCVYLTNGASLSGFTLTNGATQTSGAGYWEKSGGGVWCESTNAVVTNCTLTGNSASQSGGGAFRGTLRQCILTGNSAFEGGGAYDGALNDSTLVGNSASYGGGTTSGTLTNCTLTGNSAYWGGGGAHSSKLNNCTFTSNSVYYGGGGAVGGTLNNCKLTGNTATQDRGGGASGSTLNNCDLTGNSAPIGGGAYNATLNNCTVTGNSASQDGGGAWYCTLNNCIVYYNTAPANANYAYASILNYCCTTPMPSGGVGNIILDPQWTIVPHLSASSSCRGAGSSAFTSGTDIDDEAWLSPPSIGCDEYRAGAVTGPLSVNASASFTNVLAGYSVVLTGEIEGRISDITWRFGDGTVVSNQVITTHAWSSPGDYVVVLTAYNESFPGGVSATLTVHVFAQLMVHYVDAGSLTPQSPYTNWATAAQSIQEAVDAASMPGALILVTNGVYQTGGRAMYGTVTNRVAVDKVVTLFSVNGPEFTIIQGDKAAGGGNGDGAIRCVYMTNGASLSGFTLTNGATRDSGDYSREWCGGGLWCESTNAVITNCTLTGNSASSVGGGAYSGTLNNCTLTDNSASSGGGAYNAMLNNCTLAGNSSSSGGGAVYGTLNNCTLTRNSASSGGGAYSSTLNNCTVAGNSASYGGGAYYGTLNNCIVYFNTAKNGSNYYYPDALNYCCTTPLPPSGSGNISQDPQLASAAHLSAGSQCRGAGSPVYASLTDIDGESWASPPSIGCDEYRTGAVTGPLSVVVTAAYTNVLVGFPVDVAASVSGHAAASAWDFGDGTVVSNRPWASHAWAAPGDHVVIFRAFNESQPGGVSTTLTVHVYAQPMVHYVDVGSVTPLSPYTNWATAAHAIQDAVDAASMPGAVILVTNGVYQTGGRAVHGIMTNRVAVDKLLTMQSVNGPQVTVIQGYQVTGSTNGVGAIRCVFLADGASLSGFTLTNGATAVSDSEDARMVTGGGLYCESQNALASNCVVIANSAFVGGGGASGGTLINCILTGNSAFEGGGASGGMLINCALTGNAASQYGGAAYSSTLNNCLLTGNSASYGGGGFYGTLVNCTLTDNSATVNGGGMYYGTLTNCIVYYNTASTTANYSSSTLNYCCTTPLPGGPGNITNNPAFADYAGGDFRLLSNSPCINAGDNTYALKSTDLDGNPRIAGGKVDMGAYEFQGTGLSGFTVWLWQHGLRVDGTADSADSDGDTANNWREWVADTDPTNALSVLKMLVPASTAPGVTVSWQSVNTRSYFLERATDVSAQPPFQILQSNITGQAGTTSYTDTNATGNGAFLYRVGVQQ